MERISTRLFDTIATDSREITSPYAQNNDGPKISVVVVSWNTPRTLANCLASLSRQPADEIFVVDASREDPAAILRERFPNVHFLHFSTHRDIPELRREGIQSATGDVVALTEGWMTPGPDWVDSLRAAHRRFPEAPAIGGPIAFPCGATEATALEWADYFSEYGAQIPDPGAPESCAPCESLSGANVSYKRWAVERCRDLFLGGSWETVIHERLRSEGYGLLRVSGAEVCYQRTVPFAELLRRRFSHGRNHAAGRLKNAPAGERWARGAAAPLVPWLMFWRLGRRIPPQLSVRFWESAAWLLALFWVWAAGEAIGAWFGTERGEP